MSMAFLLVPLQAPPIMPSLQWGILFYHCISIIEESQLCDISCKYMDVDRCLIFITISPSLGWMVNQQYIFPATIIFYTVSLGACYSLISNEPSCLRCFTAVVEWLKQINKSRARMLASHIQIKYHPTVTSSCSNTGEIIWEIHPSVRESSTSHKKKKEREREREGARERMGLFSQWKRMQNGDNVPLLLNWSNPILDWHTVSRPLIQHLVGLLGIRLARKGT